MRTTRINQVRRDKHDIISLKKCVIKFTNSLAVAPTKIIGTEETKGNLPTDTETQLYRTIVANTYNFMDSHDDVHLNNVFKKTISETKKLFLLHDHKFERTAQIGAITKSYEQTGTFKDFGYDSDKETMALLQDVIIEQHRNKSIFNDYKVGQADQHSVGMYYVKIDAAYDDKSDKEAFELYKRVLPLIGNSEEVEKQGFFFAVAEAKLKETSSVLEGSNPLTGIYDNNQATKSVDEIKKMFDYLAKNVDNKEIFHKLCTSFIDTYTIEPHSSTQKIVKPSIYSKLKHI